MGPSDIQIVGAGSLGLIFAGNILDKFHKIEIFESSNSLGGIARDFYNSEGSKFFLGCQYLQSSYLPKWATVLNNIQHFEHRYASLTEQNGKWNYKLDFAGPAFVTGEIVNQLNRTCKNALEDRLSLYPREISRILQSHIKKFLPVDIRLLHVSSLVSLGMTRISTMSGDKELAILKKKDALVDNLYGVSKDFLGMNFETSYIPKFGYSKYWETYTTQPIFEHKVNIKRKYKIDKKTIRETMSSLTGIKIWCADPRQIVGLTTDKKLDSLSYMVHSYGIRLDFYSGPKLPFYVNIYGTAEPLIRFYFYELDSEIKVSIDSLKKYDSSSEIIAELKKIAAEAHISLKIQCQDVAYERTRRYFPISQNDHDTLTQCSINLESSNWLDSAMYNFDRKSRLDIMLDQISRYSI